VASVVIAAWLYGGFRAGLQSRAEPASTPAPAMKAELAQLTGTASCSGRACHGGIGPSGTKSCEYTTYILHDPHATRAFAVLSDERSKIMVRNLRGKDAPPEKDALCLSCHGRSALAATGERLGIDDAFGCESCHGSAEKWLRPHAATERWAKLSDAEQRQLGFAPMTRLDDRARVCTQCHVGSGERQVDHDLVAAGHPRLNFEFSTYLANLPRHWQPDKDASPASAWEVGQAVSAQAALELLAYRADEKNKRPWPEFAEYDCFACHHDLKADSGRIKRGYGNRAPGTLPWSDWYCVFPQLKTGMTRDLDGLRQAMDQPYPDRVRVSKLARDTAAKELKWAALWHPGDRLHIGSWLHDAIRERGLFIKDGNASAIKNWDVAAQLALAVRAEYLSGAGQKPDPKIDQAIAVLFQQLSFPRKTEPASKQIIQFDSAPDFDAKAFARQLEEVCKLLERAGP